MADNLDDTLRDLGFGNGSEYNKRMKEVNLSIARSHFYMNVAIVLSLLATIIILVVKGT